MQPIVLCWMFDRRWFCGCSNPCKAYLLIVPIVFALTTFIAILSERNSTYTEVNPSLIILLILYPLIALTALYLLLRTYLTAQQQIKDVSENLEAIRNFTHYEIKNNIWSVKGMILTALAVAQMIANSQYINEYTPIYPCIANKVRFWLDVAGWSYIALVIATFLICKLGFLFVSWKHPERYLQYKAIL